MEKYLIIYAVSLILPIILVIVDWEDCKNNMAEVIVVSLSPVINTFISGIILYFLIQIGYKKLQIYLYEIKHKNDNIEIDPFHEEDWNEVDKN